MSLYTKDMEKYSEEAKELSKQRFKKFAASHPAYHFVTKYAQILKECNINSPEGIFGRRFAQILSMESNRDINNELRLVELEKDLMPLVEKTDNKIFYRPLFFHSIFINNDFNFEGLIVKGIYLTECYTEPGSARYTLHHPNINDYAIFVIAADTNIGCEFYSAFALVDNKIGDSFTDTKEETMRMKRLAKYVRIMICNVIDMVEGNDKDLNVVTIETTKEQNAKRIKKGQVAMPTKVYIRAKGEFKKYIGEFNREISKPNYRFDVRAHWRHFWSDKFVNVKGTKMWIASFTKGEGILIRKDYKVMK